MLHKRRHRPAQAARQPLVGRQIRRFMINIVPAEQFVRALARKHHLHVFAGNLRDKIQRNAARVRAWLVEVILHFGDDVPVFLRRDDFGVVFNADLLRQRLRVADLVIALLRAKAHGKGLLPCEIRRHPAGIHAAGKEAADLHVCDAVRVHTLLKDFVDLVDRLFLGHVLIRMKLRVPIAVRLDLPVLIPQIMPRHQAGDALEQRLRRHHIFKRKIALQRVEVQLLVKARHLQKALDLTAIDQAVPHHAIVQRLDAKEVARQKQALLLCVPDGKRKHPAQMVEHLGAPFLKAVHDRLRIGVRIELMTRGDQLFSQVLIIINLAVEGDHQRAVLIVNRLVAGRRDVDNRQPPEPHGDAVSHVHAVRIRPAVGDDVGHPLDNRLAVVKINHFSRKSTNPAHVQTFLFLDLSLHDSIFPCFPVLPSVRGNALPLSPLPAWYFLSIPQIGKQGKQTRFTDKSHSAFSINFTCIWR